MAASLTFAFNVYIPSDALLFIKDIRMHIHIYINTYICIYEKKYLFASLFILIFFAVL